MICEEYQGLASQLLYNVLCKIINLIKSYGIYYNQDVIQENTFILVRLLW